MARPERVRLGDLLIQQNLLTQEQLSIALAEQKRSGRRLGRVIVDMAMVSEEQIAQALAKQLQIEFVDLRRFSPHQPLIKLLPEAQARRHRALVLRELDNGLLLVGLVDPTDLQAYDSIARMVRRDIEVAAIVEGQLLSLIDNLYGRTEEMSGLAKELTDELGDVSGFDEILGLSSGSDEAPVVKLLHTVFEEAVRTRASDIHIEPQEKSLRIRFRIDGIMQVQTEADPKTAPALALRIKLMSGLDISEKRLPQDGRFNTTVRDKPIDVRISTCPSQHGESIVMRLLAQDANLFSLDKMDIPDRVLTPWRRALAEPNGLILVTGPTGSGKTTTLYASLAELNSPDTKIITVEDPVEYRLPGLMQVQVQDKIDLSFSRVLRSVLRQDPDIVLVGEMRDKETAEIGLRAAMTGHLVLSTLHTNTASSTPVRLMDMGVPGYMVALSLKMVIAQRLLRTICGNCKKQVEPSVAEKEWLGFELGAHVDDYKYYAGNGCAQCNHTGYAGRTGVYEFLEMTMPLIKSLNRGDPQEFSEMAQRQMAGNTLRRDAVRRIIASETTIAEAMRISSGVDDSGRPT